MEPTLKNNSLTNKVINVTFKQVSWVVLVQLKHACDFENHSFNLCILVWYLLRSFHPILPHSDLFELKAHTFKARYYTCNSNVLLHNEKYISKWKSKQPGTVILYLFHKRDKFEKYTFWASYDKIIILKVLRVFYNFNKCLKYPHIVFL